MRYKAVEAVINGFLGKVCNGGMSCSVNLETLELI